MKIRPNAAQRAKLSPEMLRCLAATEQHGKLIRRPGGFWTWPECPRHAHNGEPYVYFGSSTIMALIAREQLEYVEWHEGAPKRFPIAAAIKAAKAKPGIPDDILMAG